MVNLKQHPHISNLLVELAAIPVDLYLHFIKLRDLENLSHYEFFCSYHHQLQRFVEPITVYPFAPGVLERALGPVAVYLLRNMRNVTLPWDRDLSAIEMGNHRTTAREVLNIPSIFED